MQSPNWPLITGKEKGATWPSRSRSKIWCMKVTWSLSANAISLSLSSCSRLLCKRLSRSSLGIQGELWTCSSFSTATGQKGRHTWNRRENVQFLKELIVKYSLVFCDYPSLFCYFTINFYGKSMYFMMDLYYPCCWSKWVCVQYLYWMWGRIAQPAGILEADEWGQTGKEPCECCLQRTGLLLHTKNSAINLKKICLLNRVIHSFYIIRNT